MLHRYLRDGVRPAVVAIEVMPTFAVKNRFVSGHFAASDLPLALTTPISLSITLPLPPAPSRRAPDIARVADPYEGSITFCRGAGTRIELEVTSA